MTAASVSTIGENRSLPEVIRSMADHDRPLATHFEGCWQHHKDCALLMAAALLEDYLAGDWR